jgi:hypothetical protein
MSVPNSSNLAHNTAQYAAELARQNAVAAAAGSQAALRSAAITYHTAVAKSAIANGISPQVNLQALRELGQTGI